IGDDVDMSFDPDDPADVAFDRSAIRTAFRSLPERWQVVLWHSAVEGTDRQALATMLGVGPDGVSALLYRAREGLRQAYLTTHLAIATRPSCRWTSTHLAAYARGQLGRTKRIKVDAHLRGCAQCSEAVLELWTMDQRLGAPLAPAVLGTA